MHQRLSDLRHDVLHIRQTLVTDARRGPSDRGRQGRGARHAAAGRARDRRSFSDVVRQAAARERRRSSSHAISIAGVRDFYQSKVAQSQNEVVQRLTAIASMLLFPTFVVGVYGQNFDHMPELHWRYGYAFSWAVIIARHDRPARVLPPEEVDLDPRRLRWTDAVLHLPQLQGPLGRPRRPPGAAAAGRRVRALRFRLPLRADRRLLPGAEHRARRLRPRRAHPRGRPRRLRADGLPGRRPDGQGRRRRLRPRQASRTARARSRSRSSGACGSSARSSSSARAPVRSSPSRQTSSRRYDDDGGLLVALSPR